jgi:hypothetical protein
LKFLSLKLKQKELMLPDQIFNCTIDTSSHLMLVFRILKKYTCHSGTTYRYLTQTKLSFFFPKKNREQEGKTGPVVGEYQWEGGDYKERVQKSGYGKNIMYLCMKMEK